MRERAARGEERARAGSPRVEGKSESSAVPALNQIYTNPTHSDSQLTTFSDTTRPPTAAHPEFLLAVARDAVLVMGTPGGDVLQEAGCLLNEMVNQRFE